MTTFDENGLKLEKVTPITTLDVTDLPANVADGFLKRNAGNSAWEEVAYGTAANTACQGNDARLLVSMDLDSRIFQSRLNQPAAITMIADTAYFIYLGRTVQDMTPKFVEFYVTTGGSGAQTAELGLFSTPSAPNKASQTVTKIQAMNSFNALLTGTGYFRNNVAFSTLVTKGTHLWAGFRTNMGTSQPAPWGVGGDLSEGRILTTAGAGALTAAGPWTGAVAALLAPSSAQGPDLRVTLD